MEPRRHPIRPKRALSLGLLALVGTACDDDAKLPLGETDAGIHTSRDAGGSDADTSDTGTLDAESAAPPDANGPSHPDGAASDASSRDAGVVDAAVLDSGYFTPEDCAACLRQGPPTACEAPEYVQWECWSRLNSTAVLRLREVCVDQATAISRYCCPPAIAPECASP